VADHLLRLVADGHTNGQIARRLGLSEAIVRTHLENIYDRWTLADRRNRMAVRARLGRDVGGLRGRLIPDCRIYGGFDDRLAAICCG
jgi:hypothetical protein